MRIANLRIRNFRSITTSELRLGPGTTYVAGPNGAGKSTLADAISLLLTGTCRGAESGRGLDDLRHAGAKRKWSIEADFAGRSYSRTEGEGPNSKAQAVIDAVLGIQRHTVRACLDAGDLLDGEPKTVQRILLDLASSGVPVSAEIVGLMRAYGVLETTETPTQLSLSEIERFYKRAYELRTTAGREADSLRVLQPEVPAVLPGDVATMALNELEAMRDRGLANLAALVKERDEALAAAEKAEKAPARLEAQLEQWQKRREAMAGVAPSGASNPEEYAALEADLRAWQEEDDRLASALEAACERHRVELQKLVAIEARGKELKAHADICPTCGQAWSTAALQKQLRAEHATQKAAQEAAEREQQDLQGQRHKLGSIEPHKKKLAEMKAGLDEGKRWVEDIEETDRERAEIAQKLVAARESSGPFAAQKRLAADELAGRIERGREKVDALTHYFGARQAVARVQMSAREIQQRHSKLDELCQILGPEGIRKDGAGNGLVDLESAINVTLHPLGFKVSLGPAAQLEGPVLVNDRPARLLSTSETVRVGIGIKAAIALFSKLNFLIIDDLDRCVGPTLRETQAVIANLRLSELQVLVLSAVRDVAAYRAGAAQVKDALGWDCVLAEIGDAGTTFTPLTGGGQ